MSSVRSVATIQQSILNAIAANPTLGPLLNSPSQTAIYNLMAYIVATSQGLEEQLQNTWQDRIETIAASAPPGTPAWIQNQAFNFQYSATTPQVIQLNVVTLAPEWPSINPAYQIISRCSVTTTFNNNVQIKVATGNNPPGPLNSSQLSALSSFFTQIKPAGIIYNCISLPADIVFCQTSVTYYGSYTATISNSLYTAYTNYLGSIPFDGLFRLSDLEVALKAVTGVIDVQFTNVNIRPYTSSPPLTSPVDNCNIVDNSTQLAISYTPYSGYFVDEGTTTTPNYGDPVLSFQNSLTLIPM